MDNWDRNGNKIFNELPDTIPNELLSNEWALQVHSQTLERLNERGGMSILELILNLKKCDLNYLFRKYGYNYKAKSEDVSELLQLLQNSKMINEKSLHC